MIPDRAIDEAAGPMGVPALAQPPGTMLGSTAAVEVATGEQVQANASGSESRDIAANQVAKEPRPASPTGAK